MVEQSITCDLLHKDIVTNRAYEVTGLENPNSVSQLKGWLSERGVEIDSLSKGAVAELIEDADGEVLEALKLRLLMAKTSVKKYEAIERSVCSDGRVHGLLQFYGANRTGRWAGRLVRSTRPLRTAEIGRLNYNISGDATAFQPKNIVSSSVSYRNQNICF